MQKIAKRIFCVFIIIHTLLYANDNKIKILPIDRAKFLAGQKFDFLIEYPSAATIPITITINGIDAQKYFRKQAQTWNQNGIFSYRIDNVAFAKTGKIKIVAKIGDSQREIAYNVISGQQNNAQSKYAKNVILLIGDGMSLQAKQMARILSKGIVEGKYNGVLEMESMEHLALVSTSGYDSLTTDSANSASAYATGNKSVVNAMGVYENATKDPFDDPKVENIIEILKRTRNMGIGLVTTADITDATPAAMFTHTRSRKEQNFIATDFLRVQPDVILGGGLAHFVPQNTKYSVRNDDINLLEKFNNLGYTLSFDKNDLLKNGRNAQKILGLYHNDNLNVYLDREVLKNPKVLGDFPNQPSLMDMSKVALDILSRNKNGFFLMIEGASIDKQLHKMDWQRATYDTIEFDKVVGLAKQYAKKHNDTLVIVVADHAHSASITGSYHERDGKSGREAVRTYHDSIFPTFEDKDNDGFPDDPNPEVTLAVQFANHPDYKAYYKFRELPSEPTMKSSNGYIANPHLEGKEYRGNIPTHEDQEVHAADDVVLMSEGIGSQYFKGVMDNTEVFFGMMSALGIDARKNHQ